MSLYGTRRGEASLEYHVCPNKLETQNSWTMATFDGCRLKVGWNESPKARINHLHGI